MFEQLFAPVEVHYSEDISPLETLVGGVAEGEVVGGNLTQLVSSLGSEFEIKTNNRLGGLNDQVQHLIYQVSCCHDALLSPSFR